MNLRGERHGNIMRPGVWIPLEQWYRDARGAAGCLNPDTAQRVPGCWCTACRSHLTDPAVVGNAK